METSKSTASAKIEPTEPSTPPEGTEPGMAYDEATDTITRLGKVYVLQPEKEEHPKLAAYRDGETVDVMRQGSWLEGFIQGREKSLNLLYVHTDRGPVTVASRTMIRKK